MAVGKIEVSWNGLLESLTACINAWRPPLLAKETAYSRALASYLREFLPPDSHIQNEYRHHGETPDVYVRYSGILFNDEVFIEVKRRLNSKAELSRLVGQVMGLDPGKNKILLVLIGDCDVDLVSRLRLQFKHQLEGGPFLTDIPTLAIVEVPEETSSGCKRPLDSSGRCEGSETHLDGN